MTSRFSRILSLILALCLLGGCLAATSCSAPHEEEDTTVGATLGETETEVDPRATLDNPDVDYGGYVFRVCSIASEAGSRVNVRFGWLSCCG